MLGLTEKEIEKIRDELANCKRPIFFFHDDADGLCSFLLLYRHIREGKGVVVKSKPSVDKILANKVFDYEADKVFVLDLAIMRQDFIDMVKKPVIWIDHHAPVNLDRVTYFNPRVHKSDIVYPATNVCYDVVKENIWIAMVGCVGDWYLPEFKDEFCEKYPDLLDKSIDTPPKALFESKLGLLAKIFNFVLKGQSKNVNSCIKVLTRINSPYEILNQETSQGKFIYHKYESINKDYEKMFNDAEKEAKKNDDFLIYTYEENKTSFTGELSNELLYKYPHKSIIIIAREKSGEMRMSLRSKDILIPPLLEKALVGIEGYGGGHEHACGCCVKKEQFKQFIENLRKGIA